MRRLYMRIYLAMLGSLALFAILIGLAGWLLREFRQPGDSNAQQTPFIADVADHLLPPSASPSASKQELEFWNARTGVGLVLLSPAGEVIAKAGSVPETALAAFTNASPRNMRWHGWRGVAAIPLRDGRRLIVAWPRETGGLPPPLRWLGIVFAIGIAVAVCAYPVVRRLTRALERLQQGVAAFGQGNLQTRVAVVSRDEVGKLAETFNASAERLEALVNAHKSLLANASHEIRSPLARLRMAAEAIGPSAQRDEIARNIGELDSLVEEILLASRLDAGAGATGRREKIDLIGLLAEECAPFNASLRVLPGELVIVEGDVRLLHRLFRNLLDNAHRHGGQTAVEAEVERSADMAIVRVCDRGPGVPEGERSRIFEPFYRLKGYSERAGGTGLGLALVRQIAETHGGEVRYMPREDGGACFQVTLPLRFAA
jgi:signal transduction histidine kinase